MIKNKIYLPAKKYRILKMKYKFIIKKIKSCISNDIFYIAEETGLNTINFFCDLIEKSESTIRMSINIYTFKDANLNYYLIKQLYLTIKQFIIKTLGENENELI